MPSPTPPSSLGDRLRLRVTGWLETLELSHADRVLTLTVTHRRTHETLGSQMWTKASHVETLTAQLVACVLDDGETRGGRQTYDLTASQGEAALSGLALLVRSEEPDERIASAMTMVPLNTALMKHNEAYAGVIVTAAEQDRLMFAKLREQDRAQNDRVLAHMLGENQRLQARVDHLEKAAADVAELREKALSEQAERQLMLLEAQNRETRKNQIISSLQAFAPMVAAKWMGPEALSKLPANPVLDSVTKFIGTLDTDEMGKWVEAVGHDQQKVTTLVGLFELLRPELRDEAETQTESKGETKPPGKPPGKPRK